MLALFIDNPISTHTIPNNLHIHLLPDLKVILTSTYFREHWQLVNFHHQQWGGQNLYQCISDEHAAEPPAIAHLVECHFPLGNRFYY